MLPLAGTDGRDDAVDHSLIVEEVLAESFSGPMRHGLGHIFLY
jgi:hypothetical protein